MRHIPHPRDLVGTSCDDSEDRARGSPIIRHQHGSLSGPCASRPQSSQPDCDFIEEVTEEILCHIRKQVNAKSAISGRVALLLPPPTQRRPFPRAEHLALRLPLENQYDMPLDA